MKNNGTQPIETRRLLLRKFNISDARQMFDNWASDDDVAKYMRWKSHKDIETTKAVINMWLKDYEKDDVYRWVIVLKETGELAGAIDVVNFNKEEKAAYAGYCLSKKHWNKGIMTEALKNVIGYLFNEDGIEKVRSSGQSHLKICCG